MQSRSRAVATLRPVDLGTAKRLLRRRAHRTRNAIPVDQRRNAEEQILAHVLALPELRAPSTVLGYVSIRSEVGTSALLEALAAAGHTVLLPRVEPDGGLTARIATGLQPGYRGIPEPTGEPVAWSQISLALVPGLAFDAAGHRLGYGGGFFDRALLAFAGTIAGIGFACQLVDEVPAGDDDVDVDLVITETGVLRATGP